MRLANKNIDMLNGPLSRKILLFTLPIALSSIVQQLFNASDTSIVGYFGNSDALAAVGTNAEIIALIVTLSQGLSVGVNIAVASRIGKNKTECIPSVVHISLVLAVIIGFLGLFFGQAIAGPLLRIIKTPTEIFSSAEQYLRIYLIGYPFLLLYDFGAAILRAEGDSRYPFVVLLLSGAVNVLLNLIFVIVFRLGVAGVAIATDISTAISAVMVICKLYSGSAFKLSFKCRPDGQGIISEILKTGIPAAVQGAVFCFANIFVQASVNKFGSAAIAGSTIAVNFEYFVYYGITAFGQTATTFIGQNYAAGKIERCRKILWLCLGFSVLCSVLMTVPVIIFRNRFTGLFSSDGYVLENACLRIMCILLFEPVCCLYEIPSGALRGAGHAVLPAVSTMVGTCAFRIVWICTVFTAFPTLKTLYRAFPLSWLATIVFVGLCFVFVRPFASGSEK